MKNKNKIMSRFELLRTLLAVGIAVIFAVVIIFLVSSQPLEAIYKFFVAPLTSIRYNANIIELMTPLLFTGLAVTFKLQTKWLPCLRWGRAFTHLPPCLPALLPER